MSVKIIFSFLLLLLCLNNCTNAQSVYLFKYAVKNGGDSTTYRAFFKRDPDGTGFIRVKFYDTAAKVDVLIEMDTEDSYFKDTKNKIDSSILFFPGLYPEIITGNKNTKYDPPVFWFKKDTATYYYEPWSVTSQDGNVDTESHFSEARLLTKNDLTKDIVSDFFLKDDFLYQNLFDTVVAVDTASVRASVPFATSVKMHLVIVANTEDNSIGYTCTKDKDQMEKSFSALAQCLDIPLMPPTIIFGRYYSKAMVESAIETLKPDPADIVIFYYSGHGFSNMKDTFQFPYLDLRANNFQRIENNFLNIEDIYNRIRKKGARLNLVISDCCNSDPNLLSTVSSDNIARTRTSPMEWSKENCIALFLNKKPLSVLITAAKKGEVSAGKNDVGGIFTFNFRESLEDNFGLFIKNANWLGKSGVLEQSAKQTIKQVSDLICPQSDGTFKTCAQNPKYKWDQ